jgi:hypothetical protein
MGAENMWRKYITASFLVVIVRCIPTNGVNGNNDNFPPIELHEIQKLAASDGETNEFFGWSVAISGDWAIAGTYRDDENGKWSGSAYLFHRDGSNWIEKQKLTPSDAAANDYFGYSVAISGDKVLVGAPTYPVSLDKPGSVYFFYYNGSSWVEQQKITASDAKADDQFGYSVAINGDRCIIGNGRAAYSFLWNGSNWTEKQILVSGTTEDAFGYSVAMSNDRVIVGALSDDQIDREAGAAHIYNWNGTSWVKQQKITASDAAKDDKFGTSVDISGDRVIVGAYHDNNSGSAYIFYWTGSSWVEQQKLHPSDVSTGDWFGHSVAISGDMAIVGSINHIINYLGGGAAYYFRWDGSNWEYQQILAPSDREYMFGWSVAIIGYRVIVGETGNWGAYNQGNGTGAAFIYE